ncbi:cyclin-dependent kinase inhibitor 1C [Discoglossus pictus]
MSVTGPAGGMCNVQLSDCALDRLLAKRTYPYRRTAVCRNLFGPVDHEDLNRELHSKLQEIQEESSHKWDFDFQRDVPLPGTRYQWEEASAHTVPAFYRSPYTVPCRLSQEDCSQGQQPEHTVHSHPGDKCALTIQTAKRALTACHITDFLPVRKKAKDGKALSDKGSSIPIEQTPRKLLR